MLDKVTSVTIAIVGVSVLLFGGKVDRQVKAKTLAKSTPPVVMQPVATPTVAPSGEGDAAVVLDIPSEEASAPAPSSREAQPQPVAQVAHLPAAGVFCTTGNCGPTQARRVYQVQRPVRRGLFGGLFRGRR